jgi:tetratricopeptide (TPR) repeat protein
LPSSTPWRSFGWEPNLPGGYALRGIVYGAKGELDRAIADFTKAIALDPKSTTAYENRGTAQERKGDLDKAMADFAKAIEINPKAYRAYDNRGVIYSKRNENELALAEFDRAIAINPKYANAYNNRGIIHGRKGDIDKAIADFTSAIEINPMFARPYNNRGIAYSKKGDRDKAIADFDKAVEIDPKYASAYSNRGNAYEKKGDTERAIADFRKVLELPATLEADRQRHEIVRARIARLTQPQPPRAAQAPSTPRRVALVIGISNYTHAGVLKNPRNDATGTAAALRRLGFASVTELYDLTREQMSRALRDFGDVAEGAEWAVVFFAGHGLEMNGVTYLVPADAALKRDTHVADEAISLTQVQTKVDAAAKLGLVILDSCRNNPLVERMVRSAGSTRSLGSGARGLASVEPEGNVLVAYSAKHGTVALDGSGQNSPFTEAMLTHIEEPGLEINFLFRKIRDDVRKKTLRRQEPFLYGSLSSEPLYFKAAQVSR